MPKTDRLNRTIDFWTSNRVNNSFISTKAIDFFGDQIKALRRRKRFGLHHTDALKLAVSLMESQMRDCIRLTLDSPYSEPDFKGELISDIKIDATLFNVMRTRRLTLGEFVFLNTSISTKEKLFGAFEFCFNPRNEAEPSFEGWKQEHPARPSYTYAQLKTSLARVYDQRNKYVHEFYDSTLSEFGKSDNLPDFFTHLSRSFDFLQFVQSLKEHNFRFHYSETHPSRGDTGKRINRLNNNIDKRIKNIGTLLGGPAEFRRERDRLQLDTARHFFQRLLSIYQEYISTITVFSSAAFGPGTLSNDIAYAVRLRELKNFERHIRAADENLRAWVKSYRELDLP